MRTKRYALIYTAIGLAGSVTLATAKDLSQPSEPTIEFIEDVYVVPSNQAEITSSPPNSLRRATPVSSPGDFSWKNITSNGLEDTREGTFAFPGATGHGKHSTGGRGGRVFCVNTLEDVNVVGDGLISYREAVSGIHEAESDARIVTFCVSGEIDTGTDRVLITRGALTVACQTAPFPGIVLTGYRPIDIDNNADNQIWRHCDVKPRDTLDANLNVGQRNVTIGGGKNHAPDNLVFDHMSLMYSTDDSFVVYVNTDASTMVPSKITISQSIIADGDTTCRRTDDECGNAASGARGDYRWPNHSMGPAASSHNGTAIKGLSFVANLIGNTNARNPQLRGVSPGEVANNLMFNIHSSGVRISSPKNGAPNDIYVEGNVFKDGPDDRGTERIFYGRENTRVVVKNNSRINVAGDITYNYLNNDQDELIGGGREYTTGDNELLLGCVGASRPTRDSEDKRIILELNGTGTDPVLESAEVGVGPRVAPIVPPCTAGLYCFYEPGESDQGQRDYSTYVTESAHSANYDTDNDGIEDEWERRAIEFDGALESLASIDNTTDSDGDGYLDVEEWLNHLAKCKQP